MKNNGNEGPAGLERVIIEHQDSLFGFAFFHLGSMQDAQDVVQDVFLRMLGDRRDLSGVSNLRAYLFRSVSNACRDLQRKKSRRRFVNEEEAVKTGIPDETTREYYDEYARISKLMDGIPPGQAEVIRLRAIAGMNFTEIAETLRLSVPTVKSRYRYGLEKIRSKLKEEGSI